MIFSSLFLVFSINYFLPWDAVYQMMAGNDASPQAAEMLRKELGLDLPFHTLSGIYRISLGLFMNI
ncbi:hypothetical protein [Niallia sp. 03133]|uniref:hypothetical protein n=1 Tax=Niallia sp. 03133 TaxID=3458060 RepID=UPI0040439863